MNFYLTTVFFTFLYELQGDKMKRTVKFILVAAVIAILYACATAGWHKNGVSEFETENALAQCEYEKGKDHVEQSDFVTNCMKRQGFRWTE